MPILFVFLLIAAAIRPSGAGTSPTISVGVFSGHHLAACTVVSASGLRVVTMATECTGTCLEVPGGELVKVRVDGGKILVTSPEIGFEPDADNWEFESSTPITIAPEGGPTRSYRGRIVVTARERRFVFVNEVELEDYLRGVLPAEIPASFHPEALKAQAIAARTYTLANLRKHRSEGYDLCDAAHCQVYTGVQNEDPRADAAIKDTEGLVVTYEGKPIHAVYHDACGGRTAGNETAWPGSVPLPYLRPVVDGEGEQAWCARSPRAVWTRQVSQQKLGNALARFGVQGPVTAVEAAECDQNGRPNQYRVRSAGGEWVILAGALRSAVNAGLGWDTLPSADFTAAPNGYSIVFAGRGNGHGVGLCQWGANEMAKAGKTAEEILKHYYQGVTVQRIYGSDTAPSQTDRPPTGAANPAG
jgi:stage II sporulation protein D